MSSGSAFAVGGRTAVPRIESPTMQIVAIDAMSLLATDSLNDACGEKCERDYRARDQNVEYIDDSARGRREFLARNPPTRGRDDRRHREAEYGED